jgi:hypothetical protein
LCPAPELVLERRGQQPCTPFVHLLGEDRSCMHRQPDRRSIAPNMVGQTSRQRWGARGATLPHALVRHHTVGAADQEPDLPPVAGATPRQTPGAAPARGHQPSEGALPPFHTGCLDRLPELPEAQLLAKTARAAVHHPPADLHHMASFVPDLDHLGVEEGVWCHEPGLRLPPHVPTTPGPIHDAHNLEQRRRVRLPMVQTKIRRR